MPKISDFQPKKSSHKGDWDILSFTSSPVATRPQRRPGRDDDMPEASFQAEEEDSSQTQQLKPEAVAGPTVSDSELVSLIESPTPPLGAEPIRGRSEQTDDQNRLQTASIGFSNRLQTASETGFNRLQNVDNSEDENGSNRFQTASIGFSNRFQTASETGFKLPSQGALFVLRVMADFEASPGEPVTIQRRALGIATNQTLAGVKTALRRLSRACLIELVGFQAGAKNGSTTYRLTAAAHEVLSSKETIRRIGFKRFQKPVSIGFTSSSSVLDLENLKTTTTGEHDNLSHESSRLNSDWEQVDWSPLESIGFRRSHLSQVAQQGKLTARETQDSIEFFAFDLKRNGKAETLTGPPLNFFMGILRKGIPYAPPENYVSPADEARREYRERMAQREARRAIEVQEIWDLHFREWESKLSTDECNRILPEYAKHVGPMRESCLKSHFDAQIWPELRERVPGV